MQLIQVGMEKGPHGRLADHAAVQQHLRGDGAHAELPRHRFRRGAVRGHNAPLFLDVHDRLSSAGFYHEGLT